MFRKNFYLFIVTAAIFLATSLTAFAQTQLSGRVELTKEDGTVEPFEGALVEVFRVDQKGFTMETKSDKKGGFVFVAVPSGGTYVLSVSGTGIEPAMSQNLKAGTDRIVIEVKAGTERRLTEDEVRLVLAAAAEQSGKMTADQKKAQEEIEKKRAAIEASNRKVEESNALIARVLDEGSKAFAAKNYDLAIAKFDEGYQANPEFAGSAPVLLNNKGLSLRERAVINYNKMVTSKDAAERAELRPKINQDFEESIKAYHQSWLVSKKASASEAQTLKGFADAKIQTLIGAQEVVNLMVRTETASEAQKDAALELMREYVAFEKDKKKKEAAQIDLALYLLRVFDFESASTEYRKAVELNSSNHDAVGGLGLALYMASFESEDTGKKQEALNYMQHFLDTAPKDHKLRDGIDSGVEDLKKLKLKPQKISLK
jgi:tetratricopeptide (TPR) repeat protein